MIGICTVVYTNGTMSVGAAQFCVPGLLASTRQADGLLEWQANPSHTHGPRAARRGGRPDGTRPWPNMNTVLVPVHTC